MRRKKIEIATELVSFLEEQERAFSKTNLEKIGMNYTMANEWLELYLMIKRGPEIEKIDAQSTTLYRVVEKSGTIQ